MSRKAKIILWSIVGLVLAIGLSVLTLFVLTTRAVNDFHDQASKQLNAAVAGKNTDEAVQLKTIWFGRLLNPRYDKVAGLQDEYNKLLSDVENYVAALSAHDNLVAQYNSGIKGDKPLSGDLLKTVNQYWSVVKNNFPTESDRATTLENLTQKITSNTDFDAVSSDIDNVLQSGNDWLSGLRDSLNKRITEFQDEVN